MRGFRALAYNRSMIKGITTVARVASEEAFAQLSELLQTLGFEPGKGWADSTGKGAAFLAPLGNLEVAIGYPSTQPTLMIEVTQLDEIHAAVKTWLLAHQRSEDAATRLSEPILLSRFFPPTAASRRPPSSARIFAGRR